MRDDPRVGAWLEPGAGDDATDLQWADVRNHDQDDLAADMECTMLVGIGNHR